MVATLGDGFSKLLLDEYELLGASENDTRIRLAYAEVVAPSMWAALAGGEFGDEFARTALTLIDRIDDRDAPVKRCLLPGVLVPGETVSTCPGGTR